MQEITILDKTFVKCIPAEYIEQAVNSVALHMKKELSNKRPLFISLLNGSFMFTSDLVKRLDFECNVSFVKLSSYSGTQTTGNVNLLIGLNESVENRIVVVVEDIVDTGTTLFHFLKELNTLKPAEVKIASMFHKPDACIHNIKIDYLGMEIPNKFVVGYGLDYNGFGRNYPDLYKLKE